MKQTNSTTASAIVLRATTAQALQCATERNTQSARDPFAVNQGQHEIRVPGKAT